MSKQKRLNRIVAITVFLFILIAALPVLALAKSPTEESLSLDPNTQFYVPKPNQGARTQIADLVSGGNKVEADLIRDMIGTPQAVWFTAGTPHQTQQAVKNTVMRAAGKKSVPVLVAYNIPFRDCAQFSAGGATTPDEYKAWIDGFAAGIGDEAAVVVLEPDGLGIIPWYKPFRGTDHETGYEWCQPSEANEATAADERFEMLNYAVNALKAQPNVLVYLDGTHSAWLNVSDNAHRLLQAGVQNADGFYLNVSNYQFTANLIQYGTWVSSCISMWSDLSTYVDCPNQYWNGGPDGTMIANLLGPWTGVALSPYGEWSDTTTVPELNTSGINARYGGSQPTTHFVIDTSRNGQGPWLPAASYPDAQDWCNPPDRGLGLQPTADTGNSLVDALLWVKIPGESDGECTRGLGPAGTTVDPEWGIIDPPAGQWFAEMALDLVLNANP